MMETGTFFMRLGHDHADWASNDLLYSFPEMAASGCRLRVKKSVPWHLDIEMDGIRPDCVHITVPVPVTSSPGIRLVVIWNPSGILIDIDGLNVYRDGVITHPFYGDGCSHG
jgi:hypothetical protein